MLRQKITIAVAALALVVTVAGSPVHAAVPAVTTVIHSIFGQGRLAVSWNAVAGATGYQLWVEDTVGVKVMMLIAASTAGCAAGTGTCAVFADVTIVPGPFYTRVIPWNPEGFASAWSYRYESMAEASMPRVVDQNGKFVGTLVDPGRVFLTVNGNITEVAIVRRQVYLTFPPTVYYTQDGCAGQGYNISTLPDRLQFAGSVANGWLTTGASVVRLLESTRSYNDANVAQPCDSSISYSESVMPINAFNATSLFGSLVNPLRAVW